MSPRARELGLQHHEARAAVPVNEWVQLGQRRVESCRRGKQATEGSPWVWVVRLPAAIPAGGVIEGAEGVLDQQLPRVAIVVPFVHSLTHLVLVENRDRTLEAHHVTEARPLWPEVPPRLPVRVQKPLPGAVGLMVLDAQSMTKEGAIRHVYAL